MHEQQGQSGVDAEEVGGHRVGEGGLDTVLDGIHDPAVGLVERAVERAARGQLLGEPGEDPGQVSHLVGDDLVPAGAQALDPLHRLTDVDPQWPRHVLGGRLDAHGEDAASRAPPLGGEVLAERRRLAHLHELRLRDEGSAALGALEAPFDDELGDGLAHRRA